MRDSRANLVRPGWQTQPGVQRKDQEVVVMRSAARWVGPP